MMIPLPSDAFLLGDDAGKVVIINSVGGCFRNDEGIVLYGPYSYPWCLKKHKYGESIVWQVHDAEDDNKFDNSNYKYGNAVAQWYVHVTKLDKCFNFTEKELKFK